MSQSVDHGNVAYSGPLGHDFNESKESKMPNRYKWSKANQAEQVRKYVPRKKYLYSEVKPLTMKERDAKVKELMDRRVRRLEDELDALAYREISEVEGD